MLVAVHNKENAYFVNLCAIEGENMKGTITREHTVWCAKCPKWHQVPCETKKEAEKEFKEAGWYKDKNLGWLCPSCNG